MLVRRELGEAGLAFVRERLVGDKSLSRLLREGLNLARGAAWAYLPSAMPDEQARRFDDAWLSGWIRGKPSVDDLVVDAYLLNRMGRFLREEERAIAIWEDATKAASDPWVRNHPEQPFFFIGDEVYSVLDRRTATEEAIGHAISAMVAWWSSPAVLATPPAKALAPFQKPRATLAPEQLRPLVEHLRLLFFLAYDAEGYVFWSPADADLSMEWSLHP